MNWNKILISLLLIYSGTLALIFIFQRNLLYFPNGEYVSPQSAHALEAFKEMAVMTDDGITLKGWYAPAAGKNLTIVLFHGNAASLEGMAFVPTPYVALGYGFLSTEYRGYSGLPGKPTEEGLYADARAYIKALIVSGVPESNIILFGHSLGAGVATQMAKEFHVRGLILLAPFTSIPQMAQIKFPVFPVKYLVKDRYDNFQKISDIHVPVLIANGGEDNVVPNGQGKMLFELANEPKKYLLIPNGGHNDLFDTEFLDVSLKWLRELEVSTAQINGS